MPGLSACCRCQASIISAEVVSGSMGDGAGRPFRSGGFGAFGAFEARTERFAVYCIRVETAGASGWDVMARNGACGCLVVQRWEG
eukprot:1682231-Rhodomonas_salina.1